MQYLTADYHFAEISQEIARPNSTQEALGEPTRNERRASNTPSSGVFSHKQKAFLKYLQ